MIRPEATADKLVSMLLAQFGEVGEWEGTLRIKWILASTTTQQVDEDELVLLVVREKNKTL